MNNLPSDEQLNNYESNWCNSFADEQVDNRSAKAKWDSIMNMVKKDPPTGSIYKKFRNKGLNIK